MRRLKNAAEDFASRTLAALPTTLARLFYVAGLKKPDGTYEHWGLCRTHGDEPAQRAIKEVHIGLVGEVLRTPLPVLWSDMGNSTGAQWAPEPPALPPVQSLLPPVAPAASLHMRFVAESLTGLMEAESVSRTR